MLTWAKIALLILQFVSWFVGKLQDQKLINEGYDRAIAELNLKMLQRSKYAKEVMANVNAMSDDAVDDILRELEPKA